MWLDPMDSNNAAGPPAACFTDDSDSSEQQQKQQESETPGLWPSSLLSFSSSKAQEKEEESEEEAIPSSLPTSKMAGDFLINAIKGLSVQEREQVDDDVHGITAVPATGAAAAVAPQSTMIPSQSGGHSPRHHQQDYDEMGNPATTTTIPISSMAPVPDAVPSSSSAAAAFANGATNTANGLDPTATGCSTNNVHGGGGGLPHETPEFMNHCLNCFDQELETTILQQQRSSSGQKVAATGSSGSGSSSSSRSGIELALQQNRLYVLSLRLKFIRVERYDIKKSVRRMVSTFNKKLELFGESLLTKEITISDLSVADTSFLQTGAISLLPRRDRAGRPFLALMVGLDHKLDNNVVTVKNKVRILWYLANVASHDVETQIKGVVGLVYSNVANVTGNAGDKTPAQHYVEESETHVHLAKLLVSVPVRYTALHYCYNSPKLEPLVHLGLMSLDATVSVRMRQHCGSDSEIAYKLMTFGIPKDILPFANSGTKLKMNYHKEFMNHQIRREQQRLNCFDGGSNNAPTMKQRVIIPGTFDVLLGRQTYARTHIGNVRLHHLVEEHSAQYDNATNKFEKTIIVSMIVDMIKNGTDATSSSSSCGVGNSPHQLQQQQQQQQQEKQGGVYGGRFLQLGEDGWVVVSDDIARDRVSHAFRNHRARGAPRTSANRPRGGERRRRRSLKDGVVDGGNPVITASSIGPPSSVLSVSHPHSRQNREGTRCFGICGSDDDSENSKRSRISFG